MSNEEMDCGGGGGGDGGADRGATNAAVIAVAVICSVLTLGLLAYGCYYLKRHPTARDPCGHDIRQISLLFSLMTRRGILLANEGVSPSHFHVHEGEIEIGIGVQLPVMKFTTL